MHTHKYICTYKYICIYAHNTYIIPMPIKVNNICQCMTCLSGSRKQVQIL